MKTFLNCFRLKSIIHNNLPPVKKYISCCLSHQNVFACKRCLICADFSPDSDQNTFSLKEALLWNMDSNFDQKQWFEVRNVLMMDLFQLLSSQDVNWWTGVLWIIVMFLSAVWTLILTAPIHCRASIAETLMQCYISPNLMKIQTHLHLKWPEHEHIFSKFSFLYELFLLAVQADLIAHWTHFYRMYCMRNINRALHCKHCNYVLTKVAEPRHQRLTEVTAGLYSRQKHTLRRLPAYFLSS